MALSADSRLGPYEILSQIGAGGMGEVYKARDTRLNRVVAVKTLAHQISDKSELKKRFEREAQAIAALNHPHICVLHDIGNHEGIDYLVMEHLEGETLAGRLSKGPLPLDQALRYAIEIADALDKAHRQGVFHRDLKPGNIMALELFGRHVLKRPEDCSLHFELAVRRSSGITITIPLTPVIATPVQHGYDGYLGRNQTMQTVNVAELKNNLSLYLRQVRQGNEITIKDRHRVIARIIPALPSEDYEQELLELAAQGKVKLPQKPPDSNLWRTLKRARLSGGGRAGRGVLRRAMDEERRED